MKPVPRRKLTTALLLVVLVTACQAATSDAPVTREASQPSLTTTTRRPVETPEPGNVATSPGTSPQPLAPAGSGDVDRAVLTYDELVNGGSHDSPVDEEALAMPAEAAPPIHSFEGRLELLGERTGGGFRLVQGEADVDAEMTHLPEFDFEFVQHDGHLIPLQRGLIIADHPVWNYILEPGRVWQEDGDQGYSRASFPFALVFKGGNSTYNGVISFLFDEQQVSKAWYQITQETGMSFSGDFWGLLDAVYHPAALPAADQVRAAFAQELADRFPWKPFEELLLDYPEVDLSDFGRGVSPPHMTWYGLVINGVNYLGGCQTRYGTYPYCESMRVPSFSTAKSAFVSVALMRLAQKYGAEVPELLIKEYVPEAADSSGDWSQVTFDHVLDMATGNYRSPGFMVDEEHFDSDPFWSEEYYAGKIAAAFNWPHAAAPGIQWVYRTFDTFIVTRALQNYLQMQEGDQADIYQFVVDEVYRPLKIAPGAYTVLRTRDDHWQGQALGGYGQWWIPDDLAKITTFLNVDGGAIGGEQILHPGLLDAALQRDEADRGVDIDADQKYNNAFWAEWYSRSDGFDCDFWIPHMLGYTGIVVVLMPNGSTYYYASDHRDFTWIAALRESDKLLSFCQPATSAAPQFEAGGWSSAYTYAAAAGQAPGG